MGWTVRVARVAGIDLNIHLTFLLMLPLGALLWGDAGGAGALFGMLMIVLLFACVTLHEFGHALVAQALGYPVREVQLLPIGGVAVLGRPVNNPAHELLIALAGPLTNVLVVVGLAVALVAGGLITSAEPAAIVAQIGAVSLTGALLWLMQANILLVLFNMLPAFPLDGGRVTRAGLAFFMEHRRATATAAALGQAIALLLGLWGLVTLNLLLVASALFIFTGARQEVAASQASAVLTGMRAGDVISPVAVGLQVGQRVSDAASLMLSTRQGVLPVFQGDRPIGAITRVEVQAAVATGRAETWVTAAMRRNLPRVEVEASLEEVRQIMADQRTPVVLVYEGEVYRGVLSLDDLGAAYALGASRRPEGGPAPTTSPTP